MLSFRIPHTWLYFSVLVFLAGCKTTPPTAQSTPLPPKEPTLVQIGEQEFSPEEFSRSFAKNRFSADSSQALTLDQYLDVFKTTQLKLLSAKEQGRDTTSDYQEEIASYREQLAAPYLVDKNLVDQLTREAYERLKEEVRASHILVAVPEEAAPADTLSAYRAAVAMRGRLQEGADFGAMATQFSKDITAKNNQGDLGYFTAFQMVYPFETAAYTTPVGQISEPVRSKFGYHLIKVVDRRPSRGKLRVAHIMIQERPDFTPEQKKSAETRIRQAYERLEKGEPWEKLVTVYSDDFQSRQTGGLLPAFGVGEMFPAFEQAAYGLDKVGAYSEPVETTYGWHIVRLVEKRPLGTYQEMEPVLRQKVLTDSRGKLIEQKFTDQLKKQYEINENPDAWSEMLELADSTLVKGKWVLPKSFSADVENPMLFTIEKEATTSKDFLDYTKSHLVARPQGSDPKVVLRSYYNDFLRKRLLQYERDNLENKYPEFKNLMQDIEQGVLLSQVMEEQVWQRSLDDSTGQRRLYEQTKEQYKYPERALATVVEARDTALLSTVIKSLETPPYALQLRGEDLMYEDGKTQPSSQLTNTLYTLAATMKKNPAYVVEVSGYRTAQEADTISAARISHVVRYLNGQGIPITRIMEKDYGSFRPSPDAARNRRVSFQFFSRSKKDLEQSMNREQAESVRISEGYFAKDHPYFEQAQWTLGRQTVRLHDGKVLAIDVKKIEEPRLKTFDEARGGVINAYQKILETQWLDSLKAKYPIKVNTEELEKLTR